jgi:hypothetical protein
LGRVDVLFEVARCYAMNVEHRLRQRIGMMSGGGTVLSDSRVVRQETITVKYPFTKIGAQQDWSWYASRGRVQVKPREPQRKSLLLQKLYGK